MDNIIFVIANTAYGKLQSAITRACHHPTVKMVLRRQKQLELTMILLKNTIFTVKKKKNRMEMASCNGFIYSIHKLQFKLFSSLNHLSFSNSNNSFTSTYIRIESELDQTEYLYCRYWTEFCFFVLWKLDQTETIRFVEYDTRNTNKLILNMFV